MANGKYLKKPTIAKSKPRFTIPPHTKQRINSLLGAGLVIGSLFATMAKPIKSHAHENSNNSDIYTIGVANKDATIEVNGQEIRIDPNSFIIASDNGDFAYDESGNILKGNINESDYNGLMQLTEAQMSNYTVYQVIYKSDVNVRSSPEITGDNKISTVPSLDYVLGYSISTPEYDGEWVPTLSINNNEIHAGYIREDLIREVDTFNSISNRPEETLQDTEILMRVDTSSDNHISLNLRKSPETKNVDNIIEKIPDGATIKVIGETIKSSNRDWSYVIYQTPDGEIAKGWVASNYLNPDVETIKTNAAGSVTGIDISSMSPETLREVLQSGIPNNVKAGIRKC